MKQVQIINCTDPKHPNEHRVHVDGHRLRRGVSAETYAAREDWLEARNAFLGASEVAALFKDPDGNCVSPYDSPFSLFHRKLGIRPEENPDWVERMNIAKAMEPIIASLFEQKTGLTTYDPGEYTIFRNIEHEGVGSTNDRLYVDPTHGICPLELKAPSIFKFGEWRDEVPLPFQIQVQVQMMCTGAEMSCVAGLIGGTEFRYQFVPRNDKLIAVIERRAVEFMARLTSDTPEPPPIDGSEHTLEILRALYPTHEQGRRVPLPRESAEWFDRLESIGAQMKALENEKAELQNNVRYLLEDAEIGYGPGVEFSYKSQGGNPRCIELPLEKEADLKWAKIEYEVKHSPRTRVLRMKRTKNNVANVA